jgi:hypothetical protein
MQWNATPNAGFTTGRPWLKIPPASASTHNVEKETADPASILNFYRRAIQLRRRSSALLDGDYAAIGDDPHVFIYRRRSSTQTMIVALNMSGENQKMRLEKAEGGGAAWHVALSSRMASEEQTITDQLNLAPYEAIVLEAKQELDGLPMMCDVIFFRFRLIADIGARVERAAARFANVIGDCRVARHDPRR